jgi:hypothetical protein
MTAEDRRKLLSQIQTQKPFATGYQLYFRGITTPFEVWEIPLECLVYNAYNGRIGSAVKSFEKSNYKLDPEKTTDAIIVEKFLWESKEIANEATVIDLATKGQQKFGIVTADGVIIDGNRRVSLMKRILNDKSLHESQRQRCEYFKAVILPTNASKKEILRLETTFQMGEDAKVDYNPIEKYLKCGDLKEEGFNNDDIAEFMGIQKKDVEINLQILKLMNQYLERYGYEGVYTMASGHEDSFQKLLIALNAYNSGVSTMWEADEDDISDLKGVAFDYIRFGLPQTDFRDIIQKPTTSNRNTSIFSQKDLWKSFFERHRSNCIEEESVNDWLSNRPEEDTHKVLLARDSDWRSKVKKDFEENFVSSQDVIYNKQQANEPLRLVKKAIGALSSIDMTSSSFKENIGVILNEINQVIKIAETIRESNFENE